MLNSNSGAEEHFYLYCLPVFEDRSSNGVLIWGVELLDNGAGSQVECIWSGPVTEFDTFIF